MGKINPLSRTIEHSSASFEFDYEISMFWSRFILRWLEMILERVEGHSEMKE